jgi:signal transduction histidine kinase/DNA-binding LacI/PurR family transcriptional regulator/AraC-like DNA-binding protein/CheY-like chemotaxis protein
VTNYVKNILMTENQRPEHKRSNKPQRCLTIGYLAPHTDDEVGFALWSGVAKAAQQHDVNLICFVGGTLDDPQGFQAQANILYELVSAERIDGLISWTSSMGTYIDFHKHQKFYERYKPLPIVSMGGNFKEMPSVFEEDAQGIREMMAHLIEVHGYQHLAFIRGPENHHSAQERYNVYIDVLKSYRLPVDPRLIAPPGDWAQSTGYEMIQVLFDQRGLQPKIDVEVVVAASDLLAIGALKALKRRGIQVPGEVSVVGFNDSIESRAITPLLTSVTVPFQEQASQAVEMLLAMIAGEYVPEQVILPTRLVIRRSCGCYSQSVLQASARTAVQPSTLKSSPAIPQNFESILASRRTDIISEMLEALRASIESKVNDWAEQLLDAFTMELQGENPGSFLLVLEEILGEVTTTGGNVGAWQRALSVLRHHLLPIIDPEILSQTEDLWQQGRVLIGEIAQHVQISHRFQTEQQAQVLRDISQSLVTSFEMTELMDVLAQKLPKLGIAGCYLSLYENPDLPTGWARMILAYNKETRIELRPGGWRFHAQELVPTELLPTERRATLVVKPLYFQDEQLGFVVFDGGIEVGKIYQALCRQISSVLKGAQLFKQNIELYNKALQARTIAERANQLKTRLLANVSHELRNPLDIILGYTQLALQALRSPDVSLPPTVLKDLEHIHCNAEYLRHVIDDLLDLSRAEIDELDLNPELINTQKFLEDIFQDMTDGPDASSEVVWHLQLPDRLPVIQADPIRLRQILLNLLGNARKFTDKGQIVLGAEVAPPHLHLWVQDTGIGIPADMQEQIFEPFVTGENTRRDSGGLGLGLSISRRLVALHRGSIDVDSQPGQGSTFHVYLPLPGLSDQPASISPSAQSVLLLISAQDRPPNEIIKLSQRQGLEIRRLQINDDIEQVLTEIQPIALAWDFADATPSDWVIMQQLRTIPRLNQTPFILYRQEQGFETEPTVGLTNLIIKPVGSETLLDAINALCPPEVTGPILIVDDDPQICELYRSMVAKSLPGFPIKIANNGIAALEIMAETVPSLVILDLIMPKMDGFEVLERMRANEPTRGVPVLVLSGHSLTLEDVKRLEQHALVTLQSKGILSEVEAMATLHRALFGTDTLPIHTSALVKRTIAYFHQHYDHTLTRQEIAEAVGVNKDYLGQIFRQELGLSPWEYLNRYRIVHAKALLRNTKKSITAVAFQVGFNDPSYFGRVFHKQVGLSPRLYRKQAR